MHVIYILEKSRKQLHFSPFSQGLLINQFEKWSFFHGDKRLGGARFAWRSLRDNTVSNSIGKDPVLQIMSLIYWCKVNFCWEENFM